MIRQNNMKLKRFLLAAAMGSLLCACLDTTAGTSEEAEGIIALSGKNFTGAVQKGPFVTGSDVVLRETSEEGNLEPTGREFSTKVVNDSGDFAFDSLDLKCQYALLSAEGYYTHDVNGGRSDCVLRLNAVTNLAKRNTANINLLTHFEYKRVLYLVKQGKTFAEAKKQAAKELLNAFGVDVRVNSAEDLNIYNSSDADRTLYHISVYVDRENFLYPMEEGGDFAVWLDTAGIDCSALQAYVDSFADDLAEDGTLSDSLIAPLAYEGYLFNTYLGNVGFVGETGMNEKDQYVVMAERTQFYELILDHYFGFEKCNDERWGESRRLDKPFGEYNREGNRIDYVNPAYFLCDGFNWTFVTKGYLDSLKMPIPHGSGMMTDPRDGHEYKTVSFEFHGKKYEWMAEDLKYKKRSAGVYSWTEAMQLNKSYMSERVPEGLIDSLHQGICPEGWHISNVRDWEELMLYVGGFKNLLDESWRTDKKTAEEKGLGGVFYNRFDFNLEPMDKKFLELYYHTYVHESNTRNVRAERDSLWNYYVENDSVLIDWVYRYLNNYGVNRNLDNTTLEISTRFSSFTPGPREKGRVRCVKD